MPAPDQNKKQRPIQSGDMGCQGAYFEPVVGRRVAAPGGLQKASVIATHVPSLQPNRGQYGNLKCTGYEH